MKYYDTGAITAAVAAADGSITMFDDDGDESKHKFEPYLNEDAESGVGSSCVSSCCYKH